ncbi:MAG: DNA polymerase III subunit delta [Armatimonadetes bacterium]|nr:DNA polymerase III subunit delta [Armatimonadota bacterium]
MAEQSLPQALAVIAPSLVEVREIVASLVQQILGSDADDAYSVVRLQAASCEPAELQPHLTSMSLMAEERVVVVSGANEWSSAQQREVLSLLRALPPGVWVILTIVGEAGGRRPLQQDLWTYLQAHGHVERRNKMRAGDARAWAASRAQQLGVAMDEAALDELLLRVGADQDRLASEMEKLATYAGEGGRLTARDVAALVPRSLEGSVFAVIDAVGNGDTRRACELVREFLPPSGQDEAVAHLIYMLARQFRLLWQALALQRAGYNLEQLQEVPEEFVGLLPAEHNAVGTVGGRGWMARKYSAQASRLDEATIVRSLREIYVADLTLKGVLDRRMAADVVAEELVARLCRLRARAGARA